jgi:heme exporter protein A
MSSTHAIQVEGLTRRFGLKTILNNLDFAVDSGEFVAIIGPNGAGKTTLLRILSSLSRPASGEVMIAGYCLPRQAVNARRVLGFVSHQTLLYGDLTAEQNLQFYGRMFGVCDLERHIDKVLEIVGLVKRRGDLVRTYSRGMQQRLSIGRAILHDPQVILFDEPHTGLDRAACQVLDQVLQEVAALGRTVVMTSHDLARVAELASRFDVLWRGKIVASAHRVELEINRLPAFYDEAIQES